MYDLSCAFKPDYSSVCSNLADPRPKRTTTEVEFGGCGVTTAVDLYSCYHIFFLIRQLFAVGKKGRGS